VPEMSTETGQGVNEVKEKLISLLAAERARLKSEKAEQEQSP